jgi:hypothetical protein
MSIVGGLDIHRSQVTFDVLDAEAGKVWQGRVRPADRERLRAWLARFAGQARDLAMEGCAGWRYVAEEVAAAGLRPRVADPAGLAGQRGRKRHARTDPGRCAVHPRAAAGGAAAGVLGAAAARGCRRGSSQASGLSSAARRLWLRVEAPPASRASASASAARLSGAVSLCSPNTTGTGRPAGTRSPDLAGYPQMLDRIARAGAKARAHAWELNAAADPGFPWLGVAAKLHEGWVVIDMDATLVTAHSQGRDSSHVDERIRFPPVGAWCRNTRECTARAAAARQRRIEYLHGS